MNNIFAYVSSWTHGNGQAGLGIYSLDKLTGKLERIGTECTDCDFNMTYFDPSRKILYACNECVDFPKMQGGGGQIFAFQVNAGTGELSQISCKPTWCPNPSYIAVDKGGRYLIVTNHSGKGAVTKIHQDIFGRYHPEIVRDDAVVELFELDENGSIGCLADVDYHTGSGPCKRQEGPHPHCVVQSPKDDFFAVCDKGNDTITLYQIDKNRKKLNLASLPIRCMAGSMPRYGVFYPSGQYFYHNCEHSSKLEWYFCGQNCEFQCRGEVDVLPLGYSKKDMGTPMEQQGICMHPSGKYIYDVVRGPNVIAIGSIDEQDGSVQISGFQDVPDAWPRGCNLTRDGKYLGVCGVENGGIFIYRVGDDGELQLCDFSMQNCAAYITFFEPE